MGDNDWVQNENTFDGLLVGTIMISDIHFGYLLLIQIQLKLYHL